MSIDDIDLFEVNEAFASVVLAWQKEFGVDMDQASTSTVGRSLSVTRSAAPGRS